MRLEDKSKLISIFREKGVKVPSFFDANDVPKILGVCCTHSDQPLFYNGLHYNLRTLADVWEREALGYDVHPTIAELLK